MFTLLRVRNIFEEVVEVDLLRALERSSFFETAMATLFHDATSLGDNNGSPY